MTVKSKWLELWPVFKEMVDTMQVDVWPSEDPNAAALSPKDVEKKVLEYLSLGKQAEAEHLLEVNLKQYKGLLGIAALHKFSDQQAAKPERFREQQRVLFLYAACHRSKFELIEAIPLLGAVCAIDPKTPFAECAEYILALDSQELHQLDQTGQHGVIEERFQKFAQLADAHPDDVVIRWMAAVECRNWNRNEEGVKHYQKSLKNGNRGRFSFIRLTRTSLMNSNGMMKRW